MAGLALVGGGLTVLLSARRKAAGRDAE
jgi:hypothetical protein